MFDTIILKKGEGAYTRCEWKKFEKGDTIWGCDECPEEIKRWSIDQKEEALAELKKYKCSYNERSNGVDVTEYALEFCECDEDGEFISGSDFELAEEETEE